MSDEDRQLRREECGADVAAYALGALEPGEVEAFERHLKDCPACAEDLVAFQHVADALATSTPQHPVPPGLRRRVIAGVRSQPRPETAGRPRARWTERWSAPGVRALGPALTLGLAVVITAVVLLMSAGSSKVRVLNARVIDVPGSAQVRLTNGRAELSVRHFPSPPAGKIYEVWLERSGHPPAPTRVLFSVTAQGTADIGVPGPLSGVSELMVTPEPAGGSLVPTHQAVILARLS